MIPATTPEDLIGIATVLAQRGASGFLLSGGADQSGKVRLADYAEAITEIKSTTDLRINAHVGLASASDARALVDSGIDSFSVDIYGSNETIHEVLGLNAKVEDYSRVVDSLERAGADRIAPHICVGIHRGELRGEFAAIESLRSFAPKLLTFISLIPTKGTAYEDVAPPSAESMLSVVRHAKEFLPEAKLLLGCMRSKLDRSHESALMSAGLDGIVLPANRTVEKLVEEGYRVRKHSTCCSLI